MQQQPLIIRQPIIYHNGNIAAYDLKYEIVNKKVSNRSLTSALISSVLSSNGLKYVLGGYRGFIEIDEAFLMSELVFSVPKEHFILTLGKNVRIHKQSYERLSLLKQEGFSLALDITLQTGSIKKYGPIFELLEYVKIDIRGFPQEYLIKLKMLFAKFPLKLIATQIHTQEEYAIAKSFGYELVQGYYFSEPVVLEDKPLDPHVFAVIRLYNMLMADAPVSALVEVLESNPALSVQLLQFLNSATFSFSTNIASIQQALTLIGRKPLAQWLMLLIYGKSINSSDFQMPLFEMVQYRTFMMKSLYKLLFPNASKEEEGEAFFVGVMSLASTVLAMPMRVILKEMHISPEVKAALLEYKGILGELLEIVRSMERMEIQKLATFVQDNKLAYEKVAELMLRGVHEKTEQYTQTDK